MSRTLSVILALGLAAPVLAAPEEAPAAEGDSEKEKEKEKEQAPPIDATGSLESFAVKRIDIGLSGPDIDTNSSRFREYRSLPSGGVMPYIRFAGDQNFRYDVLGLNVLQNDAYYRARVEPGLFGITAEYQKIPHVFGNDARTIFNTVSIEKLRISDTLQQGLQSAIEAQRARSPASVNFAFLNSLVAPSLAAANEIDLRLLREQGRAEVRFTRDKPLDVRLTYLHERRRGTRASGTAFGFSNVVETPEPIDYRTQDIGVSAEWTQSWGLLRASARYNVFANKYAFQEFDNPFRAVSSTDPSAYAAPGSGSIGGASFARISLPPDSENLTGSVGFAVKLGSNTRLTGDATLGRWTQDDPFIGFTTNTAIAVPALPAQSLDGKIDTLSLSAFFSTRPLQDLYLTARFRRYDLDNKTSRIRFEHGYVRYDAVWEEIPRITVPYGYTQDRFDGSVAYRIGDVNLEVGGKLEAFDRTFRETEKTTETTGYVKADLRAKDWLTLRGTAEVGKRDYDHLELELSEHASFLEAETPVNILAFPSDRICPAGTVCNLRYDQAEKDIERYGAHAVLTPPNANLSVTLSYIKGKDKYEKSVFGLTDADNESLTGEVDYTPSERVNVYGFYTRENISTFQRGRQSGATVSTNPLDDWTAAIDDKVDSIGGGATLGVVKEKLDLKLFGNYQRVDGNNDIYADPNGVPGRARTALGGVLGIPLFDDTRMYTLSTELAYRGVKNWILALGGWYEKYELRDANTSDIKGGVVLANYAPGSFFLAASDSDYEASVLYLRASYSW